MRTCIALLCLALVSFGRPALADKEPPELSEYDRHDLRVTAICIEGHVVVVGHSDVGKSGGLDMMQLQQEVNGLIVPMRCNAEKVRMSENTDDEAPPDEHQVAGR